MGKKKKSSKNDKRKDLNKKKKKLKYETRRDYVLSQFPEAVLDIWFGDNEEKRKDFADYLIDQEERWDNDKRSELLSNGEDIYTEKINKIRFKPHKSMTDIYLSLMDIEHIKEQKKKEKKRRKLYKKKDLGIAKYLDGSRYSKKYLDKNKYRSDLKKIAKSERNELKEMRKLGYIKTKDVDEELNKLKKANSMMKEALSDAYAQKHFL